MTVIACCVFSSTMLCVRILHLSASFVLECFDGSEVMTREGNELVVQKEKCVVEEIKKLN